jgi:hypothetical protein
MTSVVHVEPGVELGEAPHPGSPPSEEVFESWISQVKSREGETKLLKFSSEITV